MDYEVPPEINSGRMYAGLGSASLMDSAVAIIHTTYGAAANAIVIDDGPSHAVLVSASITA